MTDSVKIRAMRLGGHKLATIRNQVVAAISPGVTLQQLDQLADQLMHQAGGEPGFKLVPGYSYSWATCINLNDGVVHGIPHPTPVKLGDLVSIDLGLFYRGFHTDTSTTVVVGPPTKQQQHFLHVGREALTLATAQAKPGNRVGHISQAIQTTIEAAGFSAIRNLTGHGVGSQLHEPPMIPCALREPIAHTPLLTPGMTLAIEVIYAQGRPETEKLADNWTIVTQDKLPAGLFEDTVLVTSLAPEILTR